jgi:energy-converting hydrogenase A subunit M
MSHLYIEDVVESFNSALEIDRKAITELVSVKVNCSKELLDKHPTIQVAPELDSNGNQIYTVSVLALINAVLAEADEKICAVYTEFPDGTTELKEFADYSDYE